MSVQLNFLEMDINDCESQPCLNNATCVDSVASFTCSYLPGYTGQNCKHEINECASDPCVHGSCKGKQ